MSKKPRLRMGGGEGVGGANRRMEMGPHYFSEDFTSL